MLILASYPASLGAFLVYSTCSFFVYCYPQRWLPFSGVPTFDDFSDVYKFYHIQRDDILLIVTPMAICFLVIFFLLFLIIPAAWTSMLVFCASIVVISSIILSRFVFNSAVPYIFNNTEFVIKLFFAIVFAGLMYVVASTGFLFAGLNIPTSAAFVAALSAGYLNQIVIYITFLALVYGIIMSSHYGVFDEVLAAIKQNGRDLRWLSAEYSAEYKEAPENRDIVLAAVKQNGKALANLSSGYQKNNLKMLLNPGISQDSIVKFCKLTGDYLNVLSLSLSRTNWIALCRRICVDNPVIINIFKKIQNDLRWLKGFVHLFLVKKGTRPGPEVFGEEGDIVNSLFKHPETSNVFKQLPSELTLHISSFIIGPSDSKTLNLYSEATEQQPTV